MLFRILPVLVWAFAGTLFGTAMGVVETSQVNWGAVLLVLALAALVQGYPTHILNEVFDWQSGADPPRLGGKPSGGSKVLQSGLLTMQELWSGFLISNLMFLGLVAAFVVHYGPKIAYYFILPGYLSGVLYSLPPFRLAYRPFLGEWLGGFAGMVFLITAAYYVQTQTVRPAIWVHATAIALLYIGIMIFFHYLDFDNDRRARPQKKTSVVFLGLEGARKYAIGCVALSCSMHTIWIVQGQHHFVPVLLLGLTLVWCHGRVWPRNPASIVSHGRVVTYATVAAALAFAALAEPALLWMTALVVMSFWSHKRFGKLARRPSSAPQGS